MDDLIRRSDAVSELAKFLGVPARAFIHEAENLLKVVPSAQLPEWAQKVEQKHSEALSNPHIKKPLAWALYEVWKEVDKNG